jgi:ATP-binding cassette subfamily B protein
LILDEATSSLDNLSELHIKQVLCEFARKGKTVIIIAHRLTTVKNADKIIVLDKGKIMESGTHQELYKAKGLYYYLWQNGKM